MNYAGILTKEFFRIIDYRKIWLGRLHRLEGLIIGLFIYLFIATVLKGFWIILNETFILSIGAFYMLGASVNMLNQILDREADRLSIQKVPGTRNILEDIPLENAYIHLFVTTAALALLTLIIGNSALGLLFGIGYFIAYIYSAKPLRIKGIPFLGIVANGYGGILITFSIYLLFNANLKLTLILSAAMFFTWMAMFVVNEMLDHSADKEFRDITTVVFLGMKKSALFAFALSAVACIMLVLLALNYYLAVPVLIGNIFFTGELYKLTKTPTEENARKMPPRMAVYYILVYAIYLVALLIISLKA